MLFEARFAPFERVLAWSMVLAVHPCALGARMLPVVVHACSPACLHATEEAAFTNSTNAFKGAGTSRRPG